MKLKETDCYIKKEGGRDGRKRKESERERLDQKRLLDRERERDRKQIIRVVHH
jgi:hypothetical protein